MDPREKEVGRTDKDNLKLDLPVATKENNGREKPGSKLGKPSTSVSAAVPDNGEAPPPVGVPIVTRSSVKGGDGKFFIGNRISIVLASTPPHSGAYCTNAIKAPVT